MFERLQQKQQLLRNIPRRRQDPAECWESTGSHKTIQEWKQQSVGYVTGKSFGKNETQARLITQQAAVSTDERKGGADQSATPPAQNKRK